jgi:hypothetical protein
MSEIEVRLIAVVGAVVVGIALSLILRRKSARRSASELEQNRLGPGVYLFTSASCPDCESVRDVLLERFGPAGFSELSWESHPEIFRELGVDAVPATLVVTATEGSTLYPGAPSRATGGVSP